MAGKKGREQAFLRWPKYKQAYLRAFDKMLEVRKRRGKPWRKGETAKDVYNLWMESGVLPGQYDLFEMEEA